MKKYSLERDGLLPESECWVAYGCVDDGDIEQVLGLPGGNEYACKTCGSRIVHVWDVDMFLRERANATGEAPGN